MRRPVSDTTVLPIRSDWTSNMGVSRPQFKTLEEIAFKARK